MNIVVLGCGPAGLMAAHGAIKGGADVRIISKRRKSDLFGAQYLHAPIPDMTDENDRVLVRYTMRGNAFDYRSKVYGPQWDGTVSPEDLDEEHSAWDIRDTYDRLWTEYHGLVSDGEVSPAIVSALIDDVDLVISTIPRPALCVQGHTFGSVKVYAAGDAPSRGIRVPYECPDNTVICNGEDLPAWYRISNIFDHKTVEWPGSLIVPPPIQTAAEVVKPTFNNCDCWPRILHLGRYGAWMKGALSHQAYASAHNIASVVGAANA